MKFKQFVSILLIFTMILSFIPNSLIAYAADDIDGFIESNENEFGSVSEEPSQNETFSNVDNNNIGSLESEALIKNEEDVESLTDEKQDVNNEAESLNSEEPNESSTDKSNNEIEEVLQNEDDISENEDVSDEEYMNNSEEAQEENNNDEIEQDLQNQDEIIENEDVSDEEPVNNSEESQEEDNNDEVEQDSQNQDESIENEDASGEESMADSEESQEENDEDEVEQDDIDIPALAGENWYEVIMNFVRFARTQIGQPASVYNEWWGSNDGDWTAKFISYCLYQTGILSIPYESNWDTWVKILTAASTNDVSYFKPLSGNNVNKGDILVYDMNLDGIADKGCIVADLYSDGTFTFIDTDNELVVSDTRLIDEYVVGLIPLREFCMLSSTSLLGGSSNSGTNNPGGGTLSPPPEGNGDGESSGYVLYWTAPGVTLQVVLFPYGEVYNRYSSYDAVKNTVLTYEATDALSGKNSTTVYSGGTISTNTFIGDTGTGRIYKCANLNTNTRIGYFSKPFSRTGSSISIMNVNPIFNDCVSGPATVETGSFETSSGYYASKRITMPEMNSVERFLQEIIFGERYGGWDEKSIGKTATGNVAKSADEDVSQYKAVLEYLGCPDEYIENYVLGYSDQLNPNDEDDRKVLIPTIIWSYVVAESTNYSQGPAGDPYGQSYYQYGDGKWEEDYEAQYVDNDLSATCCDDQSFHHFTGREYYYGHFSSKNPYPVKVHGNTQLNYKIYTCGDIVYTSIYNNQNYNAKDSALAANKFATWWKTSYGIGIGGESPTTLGYEAAVDNGGARVRGCMWDNSYSYACTMMFGLNHGATNHTIGSESARCYFGMHSYGTGFVNCINADGVDAHSGNKWYFRGYWTPYGERKTGSLSLQKIVSGGGTTNADLRGWRFELYKTEAAAQTASLTDVVAVSYTDSSGVATFVNLQPDTYYIREAPDSRQDKHTAIGWKLSSVINCTAVVAGETAPAGSITNYSGAQINGCKAISTSSSTAGKLNGWIYQISNKSDFSNIIATATSDANGNWSTGYVLDEGTYYVREVPLSGQTRSDKNNFIIDSSVVTVAVTAGESKNAYQSNKTYTSLNTEKGLIRVKKAVTGITANADSLSGWIFDVYSDSSCKNYVTSITTGNDGYGISSYLTPSTYYVVESSNQTRSDANLWLLDKTVNSVSVAAGSTNDAFASNGSTANNYYGKYIRLTKVANNGSNSECYSQISSNNMYTLAGAQYQIIVNGVVKETITTNADGVVISANIYNVGTSGIIKEIKAPDGFLLDTTEYSFTIDATNAQYCEVGVKDIPAFDPIIQSFQKKDTETGVAQGNTSFEGAIFRWDYYDNTSWNGNPVRTWYFKTSSTGIYGYHPNYLASGYTSSALYKDSNNTYQVPLGSIKITEIVSPIGYKTLPAMYATITQPSMGSQAIWRYTDDTLAFLKAVANGSETIYEGNEPEDEKTFGSISVQKLDKDTGKTAPAWSTFAGCEFTIYNKSANAVKVGDYAVAQSGEACYVLVVDENGFASTDAIFPIGSYEIRETKGNDYYQCNSEWSYTFNIDGTSQNPAFKAECENTLKPAKINIQKFTTTGQPLAGTKFLLEWSVDGQTNWQPVFKSDEIIMGGCSNNTLDSDGCLVVGENGIIAFEGLYPVIYYRITEVDIPNGYQLLKDSIFIDSQLMLTPENNFENGYRVVNNNAFALPKTGVNDIWMLIPLFFIASMAAFCSVYYLNAPSPICAKKKNNKNN